MPQWPPTSAVQRIEQHERHLSDGKALRVGLLAEIARHVPFDFHAWLLTDPASEVGSDPVANVPSLPDLPKLIRLKYLTPVNRWTGLAGSAVRLHTGTGGHPEQSLVWREMLSGYDVSDVASLVFRDRYGCWGFLDLWRRGPGREFSTADVLYLDAVAPAITTLLRRCQAATFDKPVSVTGLRAPVVLVLSPDLLVKSQTAETERYLHTLVPSGLERRAVPAGAYNVGAQLLAYEAGVDAHSPQARVHLEHGLWITLAAARMAAPHPGGSDIAVTIEVASAAQRIDLFGRSHGLSPREAGLLAALARGPSTRELANQLHLTQNTVQDHFKSIFAKTGIQSRRELVARVLGP